MDSTSMPQMLYNSCGVPCCTNWSGKPMRRTHGVYPRSDMNSRMALPMPPFNTPSSMVTMCLKFFPISSSISSSNGFKKRRS